MIALFHKYTVCWEKNNSNLQIEMSGLRGHESELTQENVDTNVTCNALTLGLTHGAERKEFDAKISSRSAI